MVFIALSYFSGRVAGWLGGWLGGWVAGWVVGKSDFNENPVVSLDLDFGLRLRVCQFYESRNTGLVILDKWTDEQTKSHLELGSPLKKWYFLYPLHYSI